MLTKFEGGTHGRRRSVPVVSVPPFRATVAEIGSQIALVSVSGELDLYVEEELREALDAAELLGVRTVVVDLSGATFMDSTTCGLLVREAKRRRRNDGELVLVANAPQLTRGLEVAGTDRIVNVYATLHDALQEFLLAPAQ
jgi:anti-sigma B factor antagonist